MTGWREARDASGMTIVGRLELIDGNCLTNMANCGYDEDGCALYLAISHHRKRIRSILRRLKLCVKCHGTGKVPGLEERGGPWMEYQVLIEEECMACGGKGTVSFDTKRRAHKMPAHLTLKEYGQNTGCRKRQIDFGTALRELKAGKRVVRLGWNGKGMWLEMQRPDANSKMTLPYIYIEYPVGHVAYPDGCRVLWLASQTDLLAEDWILV